MSRKRAPVVITRKDKRLHKGAHLLAFMLTGGTSGIVTAAKAGTNAAYNARTRTLAAAGEESPSSSRPQRGASRARPAGGQWHPVRLDGSRIDPGAPGKAP